MKAFGVGVVFVLVLGLVWSGSLAAAADTSEFVVISHDGVDKMIDLGDGGDSAGDMTVWTNALFDAKEAEQVGTSNGYCVNLSSTHGPWQCTFILSMKEGDVVITAAQASKTGPYTGAIVGGTGAYADARGEVAYSPNQDRSKWSYSVKISK